MLVSAETLAWIRNVEGLRLKAYKDSAGVWTIGYGSTHINGKPVHEGQTIVQAQAEAQLRMDVMAVQAFIEKRLGLKPNEHQMTALVSLAYNIGIHALEGSSVVRNMKLGKMKEAAASFLLWNKITDPHTGKLVICDGLTNRRKAEKAMFERG